jgi:branched-chain amino acid transport system permease protein
MDLLLQATFNGIVLGGVFGLVALGLNLIYGVLNVINFAHGASMMIAMYGTYWLFTLYGVDPYVSLALVMPAMFIVGYGIQRLLLEPLAGTSPSNQFLTTLGLLLVFQNGTQLLFTSNFLTINTVYQTITLPLGPALLPLARVIALGFAILLGFLLFLLMTRTDLGRAIRAAAQDPGGAEVAGINVNRIYGVTFGLGLAMVGAAGAIVVPFFYVTPSVGETFNIPAFIVVVLGGLGSMPGAVVGGLVVGLVTSIGAAFLPGSTNQILLLGVFIGVLLLRPTGLFGRRLV